MTIASDKVDWEAQYRVRLKEELARQEQDRFSPWSKPSGQVYLPRTLLEERLQPESKPGPERDRPTNRDREERIRPTLIKVPIKELWKKLNSDRVLLLEGPAGMGKTTWSTHLVQAYLDQPRHEYQGDLPIRIPFRDLVAEGAKQASVKNYLTKKYDHLGKRLYDQWDSRQAVLILDGLDEVVDPAERTEALKNLLSTGTSSRRPLTMLTSRPLGHSLPLVTAKIELQGLSPQEQRALITLYQSEFTLTDQQIEQFLQRVGLRGTRAASSSPVRLLLERPGHLVHLLKVYAETGQVLETETEVLTHLLEKRLQFTGRSHTMVTPDDPDNPHKKLMVLETMAFHLLACREGHPQTRAQMLALIEQVLQEHARAGTPLFPVTQATVLLNDFIKNSGLLTRVGFETERYQVESVIWLHYLVGSALANRQILAALNLTEVQVIDFLDKKLWDPAEGEPVLKSWVGQADNPFPLFERLIDKTKDDLARHRLGTAGRCLFEVKPSLRDHLEYQRLSVQIPTEAFEVWKGNAEQGTEELVESSLEGMWVETGIGQVKLLALLASPNKQVQRCVIEAFGKLGPAMSEPVQEVLVARLVDKQDSVQDALMEDSVKSALAIVLGKLGPAMGKPIQDMVLARLGDEFVSIGHDYVLVGKYPMQVLREMGPAMPVRMQQALVARLEDIDSSKRSFTIEVLGSLGPAMPETVQQALMLRLTDGVFDEILAAGIALGKLGPSMPESLQQALILRLTDPKPVVRKYALWALSKLGVAIPEAAQQALVAWLVNTDKSVREGAIDAARNLGPAMPAKVQEALMARLEDPDDDTREKAVGALVKLGFAMPANVQEALMMQLMDTNGVGVRLNIAGMFRERGLVIKGIVQQALLTQLTHDSRGVQMTAAMGLGVLGSTMQESIQEALMARLEDADTVVRRYVAEALGSMGSAMPEKVQQALMAQLGDKGESMAAVSLGNLGLAMSETVQTALVAQLMNASMIPEAAMALGALGPVMPETVQVALAERLKDRMRVVQREVVSALGSVGISVSKSVCESLMVWLNCGDRYMKKASAETCVLLQEAGLRIFSGPTVKSGVSDLSATPLFLDGCVSHELVRRSCALVPLNV